MKIIASDVSEPTYRLSIELTKAEAEQLMDTCVFMRKAVPDGSVRKGVMTIVNGLNHAMRARGNFESDNQFDPETRSQELKELHESIGTDDPMGTPTADD